MDQGDTSPASEHDQRGDCGTAEKVGCSQCTLYETAVSKLRESVKQARLDLLNVEAREWRGEFELKTQLNVANNNLADKEKLITRLKEELRQAKQYGLDMEGKLEEMVTEVKKLYTMISSYVRDAEGENEIHLAEVNCVEELKRKVFELVVQIQEEANELWRENEKRGRMEVAKRKEMVLSFKETLLQVSSNSSGETGVENEGILSTTHQQDSEDCAGGLDDVRVVSREPLSPVNNEVERRSAETTTEGDVLSNSTIEVLSEADKIAETQANSNVQSQLQPSSGEGPPKRGRGRPRKRKTSPSPSTVPSDSSNATTPHRSLDQRLPKRRRSQPSRFQQSVKDDEFKRKPYGKSRVLKALKIMKRRQTLNQSPTPTMVVKKKNVRVGSRASLTKIENEESTSELHAVVDVDDAHGQAFLCKCKKRYSSRGSLWKHIKSKQSGPTECFICGKQLLHEFTLQRHLRKMHGYPIFVRTTSDDYEIQQSISPPASTTSGEISSGSTSV